MDKEKKLKYLYQFSLATCIVSSFGLIYSVLSLFFFEAMGGGFVAITSFLRLPAIVGSIILIVTGYKRKQAIWILSICILFQILSIVLAVLVFYGLIYVLGSLKNSSWAPG